jgi:hypothetical protein
LANVAELVRAGYALKPDLNSVASKRSGKPDDAVAEVLIRRNCGWYVFVRHSTEKQFKIAAVWRANNVTVIGVDDTPIPEIEDGEALKLARSTDNGVHTTVKYVQDMVASVYCR